MITKIGKFFLAFFLTINSAINCLEKIFLQAIDKNGSQIESVRAGVPFIIELKIDGECGRINPTIPGIEKLTLLNSQKATHVRFDNNNKATQEITYKYLVRAEKPDIYKLGPVLLEHSGQQFSSSAQTINVTAPEEQSSVKLEQKQENKESFLDITADKKRIVVGEEVILKLRFYTSIDGAELKAIEPVRISNKFVISWQDMLRGVEKRGDITYNFIEVSARVLPDVAGSLIVPAIKVVFVQPIKNRVDHDFFAQFLGISGNNCRTEQLSTEPLSIIVDPLPATTETIQAIGHLSSLELKIDKITARKGEAIILTLKISGKNNTLDKLRSPKLDLPKSFKFYESRSTVLPEQNNESVKIFEYIIQATEGGKFIIPAQKLTFFDTSKRSYQKLESKPFNLEINTEQSVQVASSQQEKKDKFEKTCIISNESFDRSKTFRVIYILFLIIVLVVCLILVGRRLFKKYKAEYASRSTYIGAFKQTRKKIAQAQQNNNTNLAPLFISLVSQRFKISCSELNLDKIRTLLISQNKLSDDDIKAWDSFADLLLAKEFGRKRNISQENRYFFEEASRWVNKLEKLI